MTESQLSISTWADSTFGPASDASIAARALVEMAELVTACVNGAPPERIGEEIADVVIVLARLGRSLAVDAIREIRNADPDADPVDSLAVHASPSASALAELLTAVEMREPAWAKSRLADVLGLLVDLAARVGADLPAAIDAKMAINRARQWARDGHGHGSHVKEGQ